MLLYLLSVAPDRFDGMDYSFPLHLTGLKEWIIANGYTSMLLYLLFVTPDRFDGMDYSLRVCYTQSRAPGCTTSCAASDDGG